MKWRYLNKVVLLQVKEWICWAVLLALWVPSNVSATNHSTANPTPMILMLLWRGETDAERGFREYFASQRLDVRYEVWNADKSHERLQRLVERIAELDPDLIYTFGTTVSLKVAGTMDGARPRVAPDIPVVFNIVADPWGAGLVTRQDKRAGRNLTGVSHSVATSAQVRAMGQLDDFKTVAALYNPDEKNASLTVAALRQAAETAGIRLESVALSEVMFAPGNQLLAEQLDRLRARGVRVIYLPSDSLVISRSRELITLLHGKSLLTFSATEEPIRHGGALLGVVSRYRNVGQLAGFKARQILFDGKSADSIPVQTLSRYSVIVNMTAAHQLDYYPPVTMMQFAEVIQ